MWEDPPEWEMATHFSILAWEISGTEETGGLRSMRLQKSQTWLSTNTHTRCAQGGAAVQWKWGVWGERSRTKVTQDDIRGWQERKMSEHKGQPPGGGGGGVIKIRIEDGWINRKPKWKYRHTSFYSTSQILCCFCLFVLQIEGLWQPWMGKSINTIFPIAHFMSLYHIFGNSHNISNFFIIIIFVTGLCDKDLWCCYCKIMTHWRTRWWLVFFLAIKCFKIKVCTYF